MISSDAADDATELDSCRMAWLGAGLRLVAPFGRADAAGQFASACGGLHATAVMFPEVAGCAGGPRPPLQIAVVANADHDTLARCLDRNGLRIDIVVDSETVGCYKPEPRIFQRAMRPSRGAPQRNG